MKFQALFKKKYIYKAFSFIMNYNKIIIIYINFNYLILFRVFIII